MSRDRQYDVHVENKGQHEYFKYIGNDDPDEILAILQRLRDEFQVWVDLRIDGEFIFFTEPRNLDRKMPHRAKCSPSPTVLYPMCARS